MAHEKNRHAHAEKHFKIARPNQRAFENSPYNKSVQNQKQKRSDKAPLFGECSKNEVSLAFGQELETGLSAEADSLAKHFSRSDGDDGLVDIVAGAVNIRERIYECHDSIFLICFESERPEQKKTQRAGAEHDQQVLFGNSRYKRHAEPYEKNNHRRTEVRLDENERERHECIEPGNQYMFKVGNLHMPPGKILRKYQHDHELHHVRRLEREYSEAKPALGALGNMAEQKKHDQKPAEKEENGNQNIGSFQETEINE